MSGEQSPLTSWQAGQGIIKSPLEWTKDCALYMCDSVKLKVSCSDLTVRTQNILLKLVISNNTKNVDFNTL